MTPDLYEYSPAFTTRAADELQGLGEACDRVEPAAACSALQRLVRDYGVVRDQIRAIDDAGP